MNFRSVAQLSDQVLAWSQELPGDIEVVAGVPRSGLLPASLISLYRHLPLTDVTGLTTGRCLDPGPDGGSADVLSTPRRVLVVDDSVFSGRSLRDVRAKIDAAHLPHRISYGVVYARPGPTPGVDFFHEALPAPRFFEWNAFKHPILSTTCIDMDVLCSEAGPAEDAGDDAGRILGAAPKHLPSRKVGCIVTSRPERLRAPTEAWLEDHGVAYGELVMLDDAEGATTRRWGTHTAFKAEVYDRTGAEMFFVSSTRDAADLCTLSNRDVLAVDAMHLVSVDRRPVVPVTGLPKERSWPPARRYLRSMVPAPVKRQVRQALRRSSGRRTAPGPPS